MPFLLGLCGHVNSILYRLPVEGAALSKPSERAEHELLPSPPALRAASRSREIYINPPYVLHERPCYIIDLLPANVGIYKTDNISTGMIGNIQYDQKTSKSADPSSMP